MATIEELERRLDALEQELQTVKMVAVGSYTTLQRMPKSNGNYQYNLIKPRTLDEKLTWLRHNYWNRHPANYYISDKYLFKYYFATMFDERYIPPLLGVYDSAEDIDFDALPDEFVLKRTISGGSFEVKLVNKREADLAAIRRTAKIWLADTIRNKARIIAEKKLVFEGDYIIDYKFYVARGNIMFLMAAVVHKDGGQRDLLFFDANFTQIDIKLKHHKLFEGVIPKPECYDEMKILAKEIGKHFPFIRVDMYVSEKKIYIGELTDIPFHGKGPYDIAFDKKYGRMIKLPTEECMQQDYEEAYRYFPELRVNPVILDQTTDVYRIIQPNNSSGSLPLPPQYFMQPMKHQDVKNKI